MQLRFDVHASSLPSEVKARLIHLAGKRITSEGELLIEAKRFRTQEKNRGDAIQRFAELVRKSLSRSKGSQEDKTRLRRPKKNG